MELYGKYKIEVQDEHSITVLVKNSLNEWEHLGWYQTYKSAFTRILDLELRDKARKKELNSLNDVVSCINSAVAALCATHDPKPGTVAEKDAEPTNTAQTQTKRRARKRQRVTVARKKLI